MPEPREYLVTFMSGATEAYASVIPEQTWLRCTKPLWPEQRVRWALAETLETRYPWHLIAEVTVRPHTEQAQAVAS